MLPQGGMKVMSESERLEIIKVNERQKLINEREMFLKNESGRIENRNKSVGYLTIHI